MNSYLPGSYPVPAQDLAAGPKNEEDRLDMFNKPVVQDEILDSHFVELSPINATNADNQLTCILIV